MTPPADFFGNQFSKIQSDFSGWGGVDWTGRSTEDTRVILAAAMGVGREALGGLLGITSC
jgi:hypothetical protein